ncbi:methyl-accepting chemotaxis protein [Maritalea mobilis]|uniref:Methyl-accepting chemotaxis protein n=2 Tax=Maritalea mobilis TaxID=483324 RepID=A0A4V3DAC5_9HYPH|nr:methyl-accepting chemotaxis protein [Maritalea mobilis]
MSMFNALNKMTIGARIRTLTITGTLLFALLGGGYLYSYLVTSDVKQEEARFEQINAAVQKIRTSVLKIRTMERDFMNVPNNDKLALIAAEEAAVHDEFETLRGLVTNAEMATVMQNVSAGVDEQAATFGNIKSLVETIGYTEDDGLRGSLRAAVQSAEEKLDAANLDNLTVKILMMRRHEKDFIIRGGEKYITRLHDRVAEFDQLLSQSRLSSSEQSQISGLIDGYKARFDEFAESDTQLNNYVATLDANFEQLMPEVETLAAQAEQGAAAAVAKLNAVNQITLIASFAIIGLATLLILGAGLIIGRSISLPLKRLADNAGELGEGNLDIAIEPDQSKSEIGVLTRALEVFHENAVRVAKLGEEEAIRQQEVLKRSKMMEDLQSSFRSVVGAASAGDFSQRVDVQIPDPELAKLGDNVNALVDTVDRGLKETGEVMAALANTNLTVRMEGEYEGAFLQLKNDTNRVGDRLTEVVKQLRATSRALKTATGEILSGANDLSDRTTRQAATIEETSAAMEQLAGTVLENAKEAEEASSVADRVRNTAEEGGEVMRQANEAMERITASSNKISNIIGMIDDIAFQTNLLALNASVEAARAGEAGKGFAVVAVEVRRLAQSAAQASNEVKALIEQSVTEVDGGSKLVAQAAKSLDAMLEAARSNNEIMISIADKSKSQASSIEQINQAVRDMDETTQHNAALVEETNAAIEQTETQASELDNIVDVFVTDDGGRPRQPIGVNGETPKEQPKQAFGQVKELQERAKTAARSFISRGNTAVKEEDDWQEF